MSTSRAATAAAISTETDVQREAIGPPASLERFLEDLQRLEVKRGSGRIEGVVRFEDGSPAAGLELSLRPISDPIA